MAKSEEVPCVELTPHNRSKCQSKACHETLKVVMKLVIKLLTIILRVK